MPNVFVFSSFRLNIVLLIILCYYLMNRKIFHMCTETIIISTRKNNFRFEAWVDNINILPL